MAEFQLRRRSLPDRLRYLAGQLMRMADDKDFQLAGTLALMLEETAKDAEAAAKTLLRRHYYDRQGRYLTTETVPAGQVEWPTRLYRDEAYVRYEQVITKETPVPEYVTRKVTLIVEMTIAGSMSDGEAVDMAESAMPLPGKGRPAAIRDAKITEVRAVRR
jgi:hypothetical protein